ncbi:MAG: sortase [Candidatus Levybacteria bacterium]|nr:sortase [Candidatus Levybacteria bacterium]MBP9815002.1 sortase [Candidatus Levybacteria bacterium]
MSKKQIIKFLVLRTLGNFLVLFMIFGFIATFGPALFYEVRFRIEEARGVKYELPNTEPSELAKIIQKRKALQQPTQNLLGSVLSDKKVQILTPVDTSFSVVIPKIGANERVTPNVNPADGGEYLEVLKHTVAHARGTSLPGLNGTTYLFAHSADNFWDVGRYNAVFYLLKDLQIGDDISVFFNDKRYNYTVYDKKIVDPSEVGYLAANIGQGERLILQTCWPPGTTWKRLLIFAKPKNT